MQRPALLPHRSPFLVSTDWLADHLDDPQLVLLDGTYVLPTSTVNAAQAYLEEHIPGAQRFDIDVIKDETNPLPHMLPDGATMTRHLQNLGIGKDDTIALYDQRGFFGVARVWWMLRCFGLESFVLDGGSPRWQQEGRALESGHSIRPKSAIKVKLQPQFVSSKAQVQEALKRGKAQVVDARPAARFRGLEAEPRAGLKSGHMPGSVNLPYGEMITDGGLKNLDELRAVIKKSGIDPEKTIISSCGSGVSAAVLCFVLASLGYENWSLYDGSWAEWGSSADCPAESAAA